QGTLLRAGGSRAMRAGRAIFARLHPSARITFDSPAGEYMLIWVQQTNSTDYIAAEPYKLPRMPDGT
ncbi:MAG: hypothetical protein KDA51_05655, partial [Planctomycetales bacterium]|nr:hypothetical protein [Planctomycetales bacterium]